MKVVSIKAVALLLTALLSGFSAPGSGLSGQETGTIRGRVRASPNGQPLAGVKVTVWGTHKSAISRDDGTFELTGVSGGVIELRLDLSHYATFVEQVLVEPGLVTELMVELTPIVVVLEQITARAQPRDGDRTVRSFRGDESFRAGTASTAADLLVGAFPGVQMRRGSQVGSGVGILIRGSKNFTLSSEPLVYVDGIRVNSPSGVDWLTDSGALSILEQIPAESVERIEVLRGAATVPYGLGGANGVILIRTRRPG